MGKYSLSPNIMDLADGSRAVLSRPEELAVLRSTAPLADLKDGYAFRRAVEAGSAPFFETAAGERIAISFNEDANQFHLKDSTGKPRYLAWTLPLPDVPDEEALAFTRAFRGAGSFGPRGGEHVPNVLLMVDRVARKYVSCRVVSWAEDTLGAHEEFQRGEDRDLLSCDPDFHHVDVATFPKKVIKRGQLVVSSYQATLLRGDLPEDVRPGSLLVGSDFFCTYRKSVLLTVLIGAELAGHVSTARLEDWLVKLAPPKIGRGRRSSAPAHLRGTGLKIPLVTVQKHLMEMERAKAGLTKDEALVLVFPPDAEEKQRRWYTHYHIMGMRGATFFNDAGEAHDGMESSVPEGGGLWVLEDARYWSDRCDRTGEWDGGLEGSWRPATEEDLARFGCTLSDVEALASEYEGERYEAAVAGGSFANEMIRLAEDVHQAEEAARTQKISA